MQDDFHDDAVSGFNRLTRDAQRVAAAAVQEAVVSHVSADPGHAGGGAKGARPAQLSYLHLTAQSSHA